VIGHSPPLLGFLFETPLAAAAVALGAVSIPFVIHLLNRRRYRVVPWAAMRFLLAAQQKNVQRMRLEQILLLAVRTALVVLLVLAMVSAMPWAESLWFRLFPDRAFEAAAIGRRVHKIVVIDGSFSMAAKADEASCFEHARALALRVVRQSSSADGFSVLLMAAPPRRIVSGPSEDAARVAEEIAGLSFPHGNADLAATLTAVRDLVKNSPTKYDEREVYFLTDLQRSTWSTQTAGNPRDLFRVIQEQARLFVLDVGREIAFNSAVTSVQVGGPYVAAGVATPISATVHHYGKDARGQTRVELLIGKARTRDADPSLAMHVVQQTLVDLAPGQNVVNFTYQFSAPGDYAVQVRLENDRLALDDSRIVVVTAKENMPVMLVNGEPAPEPYDRATEWLFDALNPFQTGAVPRNLPARPKVVTEAEFADAALGDLTRYECVFLCDVARLSAAEVSRLESHLRRGGGVVFCLGPNADLEAYNRVLYRDGEGILPARLLGRRRAPMQQPFNLFADEPSFRQPPLLAFVSEQDRAGLFSARFREYVGVEPAPRGRSRTILSFIQESASSKLGTTIEPRSTGRVSEPALLEAGRHRGRVVLFTSTVNMGWTTWPVSPSFLPLLQEILQFAALGRTRERAASVGEVLECFLEAGGSGLHARVRLPNERTEDGRTELVDDVGVLRWTDTDVSGLYVATVGQHPQEYLFAVNVPAATDSQQASESDLARIGSAELQAIYPGWDFQLGTDLAQLRHATSPATEAPADQPLHGMGMVIARWLLLAMLCLLVLEVVLAWKFGHYSAVPSSWDSPPAPTRILGPSVALVTGLAFFLLAGVLVHAVCTGDFLGFLPDGFRRAVESRLGVPPPAAGEGTRWQLEFTPFLKDAESDPWLATGLVLVAGMVIACIYLREGKTASPKTKLLLAGLRLFAVFLTLAVLLPQLRFWFEREGWPDIAIIIDDSRSMGVTDRYQDENAQAEVRRLVQEASYAEPERLHLIQALLTQQNGQWLQDLMLRRRMRLHVYHCSTNAAHLADITEPRHLDSASQAIRNLRPDGESSRLGSAVRQVLNDYRGSALAAVIMMTDGVTTEGEDLVKVAHHAARAGVPLFFVGIGDSKETRDLRLHDLQVEDSVYANDRLIFEARITAQGFQEPRTFTIALSQKGADGKLRQLAAEQVTIDPQGKPTKIRFSHQPTEPGETTYVLHIPLAEEDAQAIDANRLERTILVREAKAIKVLYIEGYARYEYRFIKNLLERESEPGRSRKSIDLKVLLLDADAEYASEDKSALSDFPTREELYGYDVVLVGDVDPKDARIGERNLQSLADYVKERGGGFLMIAGPRFSPRAYQDSPLASVLPIQMTKSATESESNAAFRPELTAVGSFHPLFRFSPDEGENISIWNHLTELNWSAKDYGVKPAAEVLLVHPTQKATDSGSRRLAGGSPGGFPLAVQQFVGAGRSMFFGFDETWRWRFREDEKRFNQFWIQTIRYLARSRLGRIELRVDRQAPYRRGEPIKVTVRFPDDKPPPEPETKVEVAATRSPRDKRSAELERVTLRLSKLEGSRAIYEGQLNRTPEGDYHFVLGSPIVPDPKPQAEARVLPPPGEMEQLRMNRQEMERAAEATHGRFYTLGDVEHLIADVPTGSRLAHHVPQPPRQLWNHFLIFALALGLLTTEWAIRKREHLV
jgi:hypothetical protein